MIKISAALRLILLAIFAYLCLLMVRPFFSAIILALAFSIIFYPASELLKRKLKLNSSWAAVLMVILTVLLIILPLSALLAMIGGQAVAFVKSLDLAALQEDLGRFTQFRIGSYSVDLEPFKDNILNGLKEAGTYISSKSVAIVSSVWNSIFLFFVFLLLYFYFLRDSKALVAQAGKILPYSKAQQKSLFASFQQVSRTVFYGNLLSALIAGMVAYMGFLIFGVSGAAIWGLLAAILSFIPTAGTLLIYVAGMVILFFASGWPWALLMLAYFVGIELILRENVIRGMLLEDKLKLHPILVFFALVGGVNAFGSLGLIYGPLIVTFLGALYRFYVLEGGQKQAK